MPIRPFPDSPFFAAKKLEKTAASAKDSINGCILL
jgi:hypothetical protein